MSALQHQSARAAGFRMPAEWEPHECCWMAFPNSRPVWGDTLAAAQRGYADVANTIAGFEPVRLLTPPAVAATARRLCGEGVEVIPWELDDAWMRDTGPNFVVNGAGELAASIFQFNAWGRKYTWYRQDAAAGHRIAEALGIRTFSAPFFLEGGAINVDGKGTLLTTGQCVLHANRNPDFTRDAADLELREALGADHVIWLRGDPSDQETDGHVDGLACFVRPGVVLAELYDDVEPGTAAHDAMRENHAILEAATDASGRRLEVHRIRSATDAEVVGDRFCLSYVNFYIANGGIVMPAYGTPADRAAREVIEGCFPEREVVQVDVNAIAYGGGGIHCITQQQPAVAA